MEKDQFIPIACIDESRRFFFLGLAYTLKLAKQNYIYIPPGYRNPDITLSIVITNASMDTYLYLELCIISMGYRPISEAGPVRIICFSSQEDKDAFRLKFDIYFKEALIDLDRIAQMNPVDYYLMASFSEFGDHQDDNQSHSIAVFIGIKSEISSILWQIHLKEKSDFPWTVKECLIGKNQILIKFNKARTRDRYAYQMNAMKQDYMRTCILHKCLF